MRHESMGVDEATGKASVILHSPTDVPQDYRIQMTLSELGPRLIMDGPRGRVLLDINDNGPYVALFGHDLDEPRAFLGANTEDDTALLGLYSEDVRGRLDVGLYEDGSPCLVTTCAHCDQVRRRGAHGDLADGDASECGAGCDHE